MFPPSVSQQFLCNTSPPSVYLTFIQLQYYLQFQGQTAGPLAFDFLKSQILIQCCSTCYSLITKNSGFISTLNCSKPNLLVFWLQRYQILYCIRDHDKINPLQHSSNLTSSAHIVLQHTVNRVNIHVSLLSSSTSPNLFILPASTLINVRHRSENMS